VTAPQDPTERLLAARTRPFAPGRFFELCRDLELLTPREKEQSWIAVRRRLAEPALVELQSRLARFNEQPRSLRLADRKDILLLLLYVKNAAGRLYEGVCGTTRILKLLFIASKELGVDALVRRPYAFVPYRFGPFTAAVYDDLWLLGQAGLVRREELDSDGEPVIRTDADIDEGFTFNGLATRYRLTRRGRAFAAALLESGAKRKPNLEPGLVIIKAQFGSLPLRDLLRYIYTRYPSYATESRILGRILGPRRPTEAEQQ
jgi:hypothetical protein